VATLRANGPGAAARPPVACREPPQALPRAEAEAPAAPVIKSPMVGTFYRSPSPGAKAFAKWAVVKEGEAVCIIEAMKIMNEIEADLQRRHHPPHPVRERPGRRVRPALFELE
jgi:acetyl-CoA carboxylase biotin carboxyl carrier protein